MTKISSKTAYPKKKPISSDYFVGTDSEDFNKTVNFGFEEVAGLVNKLNGTPLLNYLFSTSPYLSTEVLLEGRFLSDENELSTPSLTKLYINKFNNSGDNLQELYLFLQANATDFYLKLRNSNNQNNAVYFNISSIEDFSDYFILNITVFKENEFLPLLENLNVYFFDFELKATSAGTSDPLKLDKDGYTGTAKEIDDRILVLENLQDLNTNFTGQAFAVWTGEGYVYDVIYPDYYIQGVLYPGATQQITLEASDAVYSRFDVIYVNASGAQKATGDPALNPLMPTIDEGIDLFVTSELVVALSTAPVDSSIEQVYNENIEWTTSSLGSLVNFNATNRPSKGIKNADIVNAPTAMFTQFTTPTTKNISDFNTLKFDLFFVENYGKTHGINVYFLNGSTIIGSYVIKSGLNNYKFGNFGAYQSIVVDFSSFTFTGVSFDTIKIVFPWANAGFSIDNVVLVKGSSVISPTQKAITTIVTDSGVANATISDDTFTLKGGNGASVSAVGKVITITPVNQTKSQVGLGNVDNTSDANKPVSTLQQAALDLKVDKVAGKGLSTEDYTTSEKNKLASIDATHYLAPLQTTVQLSALPQASISDKARVYVENDLSDYFYDATASSGDIAPDDQVGGIGFWRKVAVGGETAASIKTKYESNADTNAFTNALKAKLDSITEIFTTALKTGYDGVVTGYTALMATGSRLITSGEIAKLGNTSGTNTGDNATNTQYSGLAASKQDALVSGTNIKTIEGQSLLGSGNIDLVKADVGLSNVDNTSDANKPISTATQTALDGKQAALGFTPENVSNKSDSYTVSSSTTYASTKAVVDGLATKVNGSGTTNTIPKFTGTNTLGNSNITDNGTLVSTSTDMTVNGVKVGRGAGNIGSNTAIGDSTLRDNTTGNNNTGVGLQNLLKNTTGVGNVSIGAATLSNNISGNNNLAIGTQSMLNNTTASSNTAIGYQAILNNLTGNNNTVLGFQSGRYIADKTTAVTSITNSILLGYRTSPLADNQTNQVVIGYDAIGLGSNSTVIGNSSTTTARVYGRQLVNTSTDNGIDQLQVNGTISATGGTTANQVVVKSQLDLKADIASPTFTGMPTAPTVKLTNLSDKYIPYNNSALGLVNSPLMVNGTDVSTDGIMHVVGDLNINSNFKILNKSATDWVNFGIRNTTGSESVLDLERIGNITIEKTSFLKGQIKQNYTALITDPFYDAFLSEYSSNFNGYNYHAIRSGTGTGGAIGAANNSTGTGSAIIANRYAGGAGNGVEGSKVGPEAGDGVFGINSGGGAGNGTSGIISGGGSGHAIYGENVNGSGYAGYFLGGKGVRIISATDSGSDFAFIAGGATTLGIVVNGNGNTGLGVYFPSEKLEVNGNIKATSYAGSATLTGTPTAPTATVGTNTTQIATTAFVQANARPYKVYTALLSQTGTSAPTATVLENTLGGSITWTRVNPGIYSGTLTGAFTTDKTILLNNNPVGGVFTNIFSSVNTITIQTRNYSNAQTDDGLSNTSIEIRVYN